MQLIDGQCSCTHFCCLRSFLLSSVILCYDCTYNVTPPPHTHLPLCPPRASGSFALGVTFDASAAGGSAPECVPNVRSAWAALAALGDSPEGRSAINKVS